MLTSDFKKGKNCYSGKTSIWGKSNIHVMVIYDVQEDRVDAFISESTGFVNRRLEWIENNRPFFENVLVENNMMAQTEEWIQKANDAEEIQKGSLYALGDGEKVSLPLLKEAFLSGLSVNNLEIDFQEDERKPRTDVYLHCTPDYFMGGACIQVVINSDDSIAECDILSDYSPDKPW